MGNTLRKLVYVVLVAVSLCLAPTVVNAGPFGPLTPQEVGNVCSRCETIITKNLPKAESAFYIKKSAPVSLKCFEKEGGSILGCEFVEQQQLALSCNAGDFGIPPFGHWVATWKGNPVELQIVADAGWLSGKAEYQGLPTQQVIAVAVVLCANTAP